MMNKKIFTVFSTITIFCCIVSGLAVAEANPGQIYEGDISLTYRNVTVYAPAVAQTDNGYIGVVSTITLTIQDKGSGRVFVDTLPLTEVDMQGSARLAVKVASAFVESDKNCSVNPNEYDYFFVVRTSAPIIGGPSAGAIMTVATISLLENWTMDNKTMMTGMINPDGSIGPVGGIPYKIDAAYAVGATSFLIPKGQGTYTEIKTTVENGWIVRTPITKNVADYAMDNYGIKVVEVAEIYEAVKNFTGYELFFDEPYENVTIKSDNYIETMRLLASNLLNEATAQYENASSLFENSTENIPNYYLSNYREQISEILDYSKSRLGESNNWYGIGMYYTSTTKSFLSMIDSRFVQYACEYYNSNEEDRDTYLEDLIDDSTSFYENKGEIARNTEINGITSLQCVGAAQKRASEADSFLSDATNSYEEGAALTSLYYVAKAMERSKSVGWWIDITSHFNDTGDVDIKEIENLALEYTEDTQQSIIYSNIILQEIGETSEYLDSAESLLRSARDNIKKDYPAAALFESLEALIEANLAIETIGLEEETDFLDKIYRANISAGTSITRSTQQKIEPVLAISYYEYADSLLSESNLDAALFYYKYSAMIAGALTFTNTSKGTATSRYVGILESSPIFRRETLDNKNEYFIRVFIAVFAAIAGLGVGLIITGIFSKKKEDKFSDKWIPRSINGYNRRQKKQHHNEKDMPRNINDFYKKNK